MYRRIISLGVIALSTLSLVPARGDEFLPVSQWPSPAPGAFGVVGTNLDDGRLVLWNGGSVYFQDAPGGGRFNVVATGYAGDPGFIALSPDGDTLLLGAGFTPRMYLVDVNAPDDYAPSSEIAAPTQYSGVYLSDSLVAIDRSTDDFSRTEIIVLDVSGSKNGPQRGIVLRTPPGTGAKATILEKPEFSFSSNVAVNDDRTDLYVMDANARELRRFSVAAVVAAFEGATQLDWTTDGVLIGSAGDYFTGGVSGITPEGHLVIGGSEGFGMPGGIQIVDPITGDVLELLDPAGTQPFYSVIYNSVLDQIIATSNNFVDPTETFATEDAIATLPALGALGLGALVILVALAARRQLVRA